MDRPRKKGDFADRFGLGESVAGPDFPDRMRSSSSQTNRQPDLDVVFRTLGRLVFTELKKVPGQPFALFDLIDRLSMSIEEILPVVRWLEESGFVQVVERPRNGNWLITATEEGRKLFA